MQLSDEQKVQQWYVMIDESERREILRDVKFAIEYNLTVTFNRLSERGKQLVREAHERAVERLKKLEELFSQSSVSQSNTLQHPPAKSGSGPAATVPALFEVDADGNAEGIIHYFCTENCRDFFEPEEGHRVMPRDAQYIRGTICEECGESL